MRNEFLIDSIMLLSGEKSGHMSKYAFTSPANPSDPWADGPALWETFEKEVGDNYPYKRERHHIRWHAPRISDLLPNHPVSLIEVGPGSINAVRHKTTALIKAFNHAARNKQEQSVIHYTSFDISASFAQQAAEYIDRRHGIASTALTGDLTVHRSQIPVQGMPLTVVFGGTLFNAPTMRGLKPAHIIASYLENIADMTGRDGYILVSQDVRINKRSRHAYRHDTCREACLSIVHKMASDLPVHGLAPYAFDYAVNWNAEHNLLTMNAVYNLAKPAHIVLSGFERTLCKGDTLPLVNAYKFPATQFQDIARRAGLGVMQTFQTKGDNIALHLLRVP